MSVNWVMLSPNTNPPFTPLPNEQILFTSPPRVTLAIQTPSHYPAKQQQPYKLSHPSGILYLTSRRIMYLPDKSTDTFQSFNAPILNLHDSHVTYPFFGPNVWTALVQPVQGGGIPAPASGVLEMKLTFKDGGVFDFHTQFERLKERLQQAMEVSRVDGAGPSTSASVMNDLTNVNLEDLPAYQEESDGPLIPPTAASVSQAAAPVMLQHQQRDSGVDVGSTVSRPTVRPTDSTFNPPDEPPPGYEEAQIATLNDEAGWREQQNQQT